MSTRLIGIPIRKASTLMDMIERLANAGLGLFLLGVASAFGLFSWKAIDFFFYVNAVTRDNDPVIIGLTLVLAACMACIVGILSLAGVYKMTSLLPARWRP